MKKYIKLFFFLNLFLLSIENNIKLDHNEIIRRIESIIYNKEAPLLAGGLAVIKDNKTLFCKSLGKARLNKDGSINKTANEFIKYRTASISKLFTAIAIWKLEEQGLLNVTDEASKYLNFSLKNPKFPNIPITIEMLLSHTSSISESGPNYNIPYNHHISEFFNKDSEIYYEGSYSNNEPGFFNYVNLNYCLLGTIIESVSKQRFDLYMIEHILKPLNITGSFNIYEMSEDILNETGTLYEKLTNGAFNVNGNWTAKKDDFTNGYPKANYSEYIIGTNGALFGPMGSLRISLSELTHLIYMFLNNGTYNNNIILKPETIEKMFKIIWKYDDIKNNGNTYNGYNYAYAGGPSIITNIGRNRLHEKKNLNFSGHTANAYGLFGGVFFDRIKGYGLVYRGNGVSRSLEEYVGNFSPYNQWALDFIKLADEIGQFDYPEINTEDKKKDENGDIIYIFIIIAIIILCVLVGLMFWKIYKKNNMNNNDNKKEDLLNRVNV